VTKYKYKFRVFPYSLGLYGILVLIIMLRFPDEVIGFFSINLILPAALGPRVYSTSNRNEYQELIK
jgi:hypothetical protein